MGDQETREILVWMEFPDPRDPQDQEDDEEHLVHQECSVCQDDQDHLEAEDPRFVKSKSFCAAILTRVTLIFLHDDS